MLSLKEIQRLVEGGGEALVYRDDGGLMVGPLEILLNDKGEATVLTEGGTFMGTFDQADTLFRLLLDQGVLSPPK